MEIVTRDNRNQIESLTKSRRQLAISHNKPKKFVYGSIV